MNKENPKKNKKSFEYYIAQRKEEFRCQYDHERSWENLQYKLQKRKNHRLSLYCVAASAAFLFLILGGCCGFISGNRQPQGYPYFREWRKSGSVC